MPPRWTLAAPFVLRHAGFPFDWLVDLGFTADTLATVDACLDDAASAALRIEAEARFEASVVALRSALHARAADPSVQEAVFLSSPDVHANVWSRWVASPPAAPSSRSRRTERVVYAYLQRLCAKNETTSFFGPMGYAVTEGDDDAVEVRSAGPSQRRTFLAYWAVEALGFAIAADVALWAQLPLARSPLWRLDVQRGEARCEAIGRIVPLGPAELRLLAAASAPRTATDLTADLGVAVDALETLAEPLFATGVLLRRLWFRSDEADTLGNLRAALLALPPSPARSRWAAEIDAFDALRAAFETAPFADRPARLRDLEARFVAVTGRPARRAGGRLYTDRLVLNEEASSPFGLRVGGGALARLGTEVSPLLERCAAHGDAYAEACARAVAAEHPGSAGFFGWASALRDLPAPTVPTVTDDAAARDVPRFASPDLCLRLGDDGALHPVLSSVHAVLLTEGWLFTFLPRVAGLAAPAEAWVRHEAAPDLLSLATGRHNKGYYAFPGPRAAAAPAELAAGPHDVVAAADLTVSVESGAPVLRDAAGGRRFLALPLADLTLHPPFVALATPPAVFATVGAGAAHTPRVCVGHAVYQRERWTLGAAALRAATPFQRFVALRRARRDLGLPRFVFARVDGERKPFLVDVESPFAAELLAHHARDVDAVRLEEMLPAPDELWLRDSRGRYTCELRVQARREVPEDPGTARSVAPRCGSVAP